MLLTRDRVGAEICGDPQALADALRKLELVAMRAPNETGEANPATAHMFIVNPLHTQTVDNLFSTHPKTAKSIKALQAMAGGNIRDGAFA